MANEMMDLADFDIIFQRVSQIRIVGKFIVIVCVTCNYRAERKTRKMFEEEKFGRSKRNGMK